VRALGKALLWAWAVAGICSGGWAWAGCWQRLPEVPRRISLCGEPVPLHLPWVAEALDREVVISAYDRAQVVMWIKRAARYFPYISSRLRARGLPEDLKYLAVAESSLLTHIRSPAGAVGPWQFLASTAKRYGLVVNKWVDERRDLERATEAALTYLTDLREEFGSWTLAMAAYNCGERRLRREILEQGLTDYYHLYLPKETRRYIFRILAAKIILSHPGRYGYCVPARGLYKPLNYERVELHLRRKMHILRLARAAGTTFMRIKLLNPWLVDYYIPRGQWIVRVPVGSAKRLRRRLKIRR